MNNIEKLNQYTNDLLILQKYYDDLKAKSYNQGYSQKIGEQMQDIKKQMTKADFKKRIVLNNLYAIVIEVIENQGYEIVKKYLNRNIGEKTLQKIEDEFNQIIFPLTGFNVYVRHDYYTNVYNNVKDAKRFEFWNKDIGLDTGYYIDGESLKCCYIMEKVTQIEDVEAEAEKLTQIYYEAVKKLQAYEEEMNKYRDEFISNFGKNTYTDNISKISSSLCFYAPIH